MRFIRPERALSILGHPAVLMPIAVVWSSAAAGLPSHTLWVAALATVLTAVAVGVYSLLQVRSGRWSHVDASRPRERRELNLVLIGTLLAAALLLWLTDQPWVVLAGVLASASIVAVAQVLLVWFKVSLHVAFAMLAASLLWPSVPAVLAWCVLALGVGWSRLVLGRHTPLEVVTGALLGAAVGFAFHRWVA